MRLIARCGIKSCSGRAAGRASSSTAQARRDLQPPASAGPKLRLQIPSEFSGIFAWLKLELQSRNFCLCRNSARLCAGAWEQSVPLDGGFSWREFRFIPLEVGLAFPFYDGGKEKPLGCPWVGTAQISLGFNLLSWREKLLKDFRLEKGF